MITKQHRKQFFERSARELLTLLIHLSQTIKKAKDYYHNIAMKQFLLSSPAKFWRHFSSTSTTVPNLCINGETASEKLPVAESLKSFFCSVFTVDNGEKPIFVTLYSAPPFSELIITDEGVIKVLLNIDTKKFSGVDDIPNAFLFRYPECRSKLLCVIFNKSYVYAQ